MSCELCPTRVTMIGGMTALTVMLAALLVFAV
jgi:hypothetical protein